MQIVKWSVNNFNGLVQRLEERDSLGAFTYLRF